ncbi:MAG TPA: transcription termination/antitermination NusG family protein [Xanthobacteraceae bacterium]|jgi:transcriptional antiterminator RfaH
MFWAVAQTESQREKTAQRFLEHNGFETYLPMLRLEARTVALFPAYLFVRVGEFRWSAIDNTIGVIRLLRAGERPAELREGVVSSIRKLERNGVVRLPAPRGLQLGDKLRIVRGSFVDHIGLYDGMSTRDRQFVLLELLGRKVRVEIASQDTRAV